MEIIFIALVPIAFIVGFSLGRSRESRKVTEALAVAGQCMEASNAYEAEKIAAENWRDAALDARFAID